MRRLKDKIWNTRRALLYPSHLICKIALLVGFRRVSECGLWRTALLADSD